jgi:hypothetical protein
MSSNHLDTADANNSYPGGVVPPLNADLMNLYNRIKDLYVQLGNEQRTLQLALRQTEQQEQKINHRHRRRLLQCVNARNSVELEIFRVQDQIELCQASMVKYNHERAELEVKYQEVQAETNHHIDTVYGTQQLKMDLYIRALTETIQARQKKIQKRDDQLAAIRAECNDLKAKEHADKQKTQRIRQKILHLSDTTPGGADADISALSNLIRDVIQEVRLKAGMMLGSGQELTYRDTLHSLLQRAQLRQDLKSIQDDNTKANERLLEWETKRVNFFAKK